MTSPRPAEKSSLVARRGLFVTALLLGLGLGITAWTSFRGAASLAETVSQGQAERLLESLRGSLPPGVGPPSSEALEPFVAAHRSEGLRAVMIIGPDGRFDAVAGSPSGAPFSAEERGPERSFRRLGDRLRVITVLPPPPGHELRHPPPGAAPRIVVEFDPILADELVGRSTRALGFGAGAALVLVGAAIVFWRRAQRADALAERLAESERLASLGTMSAVLAHEIKNPLAALKGNAQLLLETLPEGTRPRAQADRVVDAAVRLQGLVDNLLDFARKGGLDRAPVDPAELVRSAVESAAPAAQLDASGAPPSWSLDAVRLRQALENLLRNAAQASPDEVSASVAIEGGALVVRVGDRGPGVPPGDEEKIFEPFHTTKSRGVGLGLTVARRIVELHGGTLTARAREGGGAELTIMIPRAGVE